MSGAHVDRIDGTPSEDEVAAIAAAAEALWPKPTAPAVDEPAPSRAWRMSGRWWSRPLPVRRDRPWR